MMASSMSVRNLPLLLLLTVPGFVQAAHILLMPYPYRSHVHEFLSIGSGLLERGHRVTILLSESYPELEALRQKPEFRVVTYAVRDPDYYTRDYSDSETDWVTVALEMDPIDELRTNVVGFEQFCTNPLEDPDLPSRLLENGQRPDLALVDAFPCQRCYWIICRLLGIPYVSSTAQYEPWLWRVPALPSFVPFPFAAGGWLTERMTFWERVRNVASLLDWTVWPRLRIVEDELVQRYLPNETYSTLAARSLLWLIDTDSVLDYARPTMPNEINIGGLSTRPAVPLSDGPLEKFVRSSVNRLVIASFGSQDVAGNRYFATLFKAFSQFPELNFIWRLDADIPEAYSDQSRWPSNIMTSKWIPQNDLLGHNNTVLFISHCGANSQYEALYHGVPLICLAYWGDQMYNAARIQYRGLGLHLGRLSGVNTDNLVSAIRQLTTNRSYAENMQLASAIFRSQPMTPRQRAVWWIEHVIQYGAKHLHSYGVDMPWYQYLMLDLVALFVVLPVAVVTFCLTACVCWLRKRRQLDNEMKTKKRL